MTTTNQAALKVPRVIWVKFNSMAVTKRIKVIIFSDFIED